MKFINILFIACLMSTIAAVSTANAQETESNHSLQSGSRALQFEITDDFNLDSFTGSVFSYKRQLTETKANRIGVSLNGAVRDQNFPDRSDEASSTDLIFNLGVNYTWMNYIDPEADVKFYYGYGPGIDIGYAKSDIVDTDNDQVRKSREVGVSGLAYTGVDWFFQESMSIHAEYRASVRFSLRKDTNEIENTTDNEVNTKELGIGGNGVRFGVSVYF